MTMVLVVAWLSGYVTRWLWPRVFGPGEVETRAERLLDGERFK